MEITDIVRKIQALLAKAQNNNFPEEAATAIRIAERLMKQYNLSREEIDLKNETVLEVDFLVDNKSKDWKCHLALLLSESFYCKVIAFSGTKGNIIVKFMGARADMITSTFIYHYLSEAIERMTSAYILLVPIKQKEEARQSYPYGITLAIEEKLKVIKEAEKATYEEPILDDKALIIIKNSLVTKHLAEKYNNPSGGIEVDQEGKNKLHLVNGYFDGKKLNIRKGVENTQENNKIE